MSTFRCLPGIFTRVLLLIFTLLPACTFKVSAQPEISPVPARLLELLRKSKPDTNRVKLYLEIGGDHLQFTHVPKANLDSAFAYAGRAIALSNLLHARDLKNQSLILKGYTLVEMNRQKDGVAYFMLAIHDYKKWPFPSREAETWKSIGDVIISDTPEHIQLRFSAYHEADSIYRLIHQPLKSVDIQKQVADIFLQTGKYKEAEIRLLSVISQLKRLHYPNLHYTYDLLAAVARHQQDLKNQPFYRLEVVKSMETTGDREHAIEFYSKLADVYSNIGRLDRAEVYLKKALAAKTSHFYVFFLYGLTIKSVNNLIAENKVNDAIQLLKNVLSKSPPTLIHDKIEIDLSLARCYWYLKRNDLSKHYIMLSAKKIDSAYQAGQLNDKEYFGNNTRISGILIAMRQFNIAAVFMNKVLKTPKVQIDPLGISNYELQRYAIDSARGNFRSALEHYKKHQQIQDSLFSVVKTRKIDSLQFAFENRQKDHDLSIKTRNIKVLTANSALQKSKFEQTIVIRNLILTGSVMLLLSSGLFYQRYQKQLRSNLLLHRQRKEISDQNEALQTLGNKQKALITEKEWLLKEIHHRVKNNLQIVTSLLSSHSVYLKDEAALNAVATSQHRVQAMSLIHQKLYNSNDITDVYMPEYIGDLLDYLTDSFQSAQSVYIEKQIDMIRLDVASAVPLGLILNEVLTNAFKYAFPHGKDDRIFVRLTQTDQQINLLVTDNGPGFPKDFDIQYDHSFGMTLIKGMAEDLEGEIEIKESNGIRVSLTFKKLLTGLQHFKQG